MRSYKKGIYVYNFFKKMTINDFKTWSRNTTINSEMIGKMVHVHNGKQFIAIKITPLMIGRKLGEFSFTRKIYQYKKGKKN